ncbi:MAG TPA: hypothetical protein PKG74_01920 [Candidatus Colwellbacteria bacterium]|nr:hypothetical protein [Candidatus Colwellbacteria bacterium]
MRRFRGLDRIRKNPESFQIVLDGMVVLIVVALDPKTPWRQILGVMLLVSAFVSLRRQHAKHR